MLVNAEVKWADATRVMIEDEGGEAITATADVTNPEQCQQAINVAVEGEGWDIGWAALYLASDEARFVTGIVLPVDGGFLLTSAPN